MAKHLLRGRIRLSTVLIALLFILTLTTYLLVRPMPASVAGTGTGPSLPPSPASRPSPTSTPAASPTPTATTPHPTRTPKAAPSPTADANSPSASP
jgi:hypothetical protein